jgi:hypothetical protein
MDARFAGAVKQSSMIAGVRLVQADSGAIGLLVALVPAVG